MTANLPETPRKHLQNVIAFILACFLSFGPGAYALPVEAEDEGIPIDFFPGFTFKRSSIPSFFDMTAEESLQPVIPADLYIVLLIVPDKGRYMAIPCTGAEYIIVRDKEKDTKTNKKLLESGQAILASELSNSISQGMIDGIGKKKTMLLKALSTDEIVSVGAYVRDPIVGMTLLQCLVSQKYANLLLDDARGPDREKNGYSFAVVSFPEYLKQYCERFPSRDRLIPGDLLKKEVTVGQFIRDMYMKIIPAPLWPAQTTFATQNLSIPELTKTKLQETLAENNIGLGIVLNMDDFPVKIIPYCYDESNGAYIDLFTNRKMDLQGVAAWMSLDMGNPLFEQDFNYSSSLMQHFQAFPKLSNISRHFELKESYSILSGYPGQIGRASCWERV